jgi:hypothetical protein
METIGLESQSKLGLECVSSCSKIFGYLKVVIKALKQEVLDLMHS